MKKTAFLLTAPMLAVAMQAQTLNVACGNIRYAFPSEQAGEMNYANVTTLTIMGKAFDVDE